MRYTGSICLLAFIDVVGHLMASQCIRFVAVKIDHVDNIIHVERISENIYPLVEY